MNIRSAFFLSMAASVAIVACGGSDASTSPIASTASSATNGTGKSGASTAANSVTGTVSGVGGTCPAVTFKLENKTISTNAATTYGDLKCAELKNGAKVTVVGTAQADGSIVATQVRIPPPPPPPVSVTGTISGFTGPCPTVTFKLESKTVKTNTATGYGDKTCADLKNDVKVGVAGTAQADGSILATKVVVSPPPPPQPVSVSGTVSAASGTCPAVTFKLESKTISTNAATTYGDLKCAELKNGAKITVAGLAQADGSILATQVRIAPPPVPAPVPAITGAITALTGTCPALTITVGAKTARTTSTTVFEGKGCGDLKVGTNVGIFGTVSTTSSALVATKVVSPK